MENEKVASIEEAKRLIEEEEKRKQDLFIKEYEELCRKHGYRVIPIAGLQLDKIPDQTPLQG